MKEDILNWWNALDAESRQRLAKDYGWTDDLDDITITKVVQIYNAENEKAFVFPTNSANSGYVGIDKDGNEFWTEDFEHSIGE